ncbi:MAG: protein-methionine-sulfoxide reductase catalytic subunit MsrP [Gammaproteobacteria bacterium]|nr:protein-methionine-sulfoxide reductase catalytic subunit MsrP [Gammaproteobacteria bacterium]MDT8371056.1 protein-methionine-sulfoxide reductase catalytic subunit MsrP [Gammaproteobacteria bacterium]
MHVIAKKRLGKMPAGEITDHKLYLNRRQFINAATAITTASLLQSSLVRAAETPEPTFTNLVTSNYSTQASPTPFDAVTTYNNFYEFGTDKASPAILATEFPDKTKPWHVTIDGECDKPGQYDYDDLIRPFTLEERIYRFRCVEGWSMVIPWVGFPLADLIKRAQPNSKAKFVQFTTLYDPEQLPGQRRAVLDWPYIEGLRMDEAMNPLTILSVGLYGRELLGQNGAPIRLVVPWKYGFKSIKSIVNIRFVETLPRSAWMKAGPREYGFYSNVNPTVDHPRWSQSRERRIGELLKRKTELFNGYGEHVAHLYTGMDLKKYF